MIAEGRVALNGSTLDTPATILRNLAGVTVDGDPVEAPSAARLFLYHKPTGLLVTERDPAGRTTIYDRLPQDLPRLVPVGRLDLNTEGLLLMTTDGGLKRQARTSRDRRRARLSRTRLRQHHAAATRGTDRGDRDRGRALRFDQRQYRASDRCQCVDRDDPDRGQEPRSPPRARASGVAGLAPDPDSLWPVRAWRPAAGTDRRSAPA
ncbi:pseudouridine synthase [Sphingomonas aurantiaca]|uniref:pseudouridine synthase n=1 Tax=Sphingomonas aurantiaca TaxID=185949 RepID=UPI002FE16927